jgi:hypothetical protein
MKTTKATKTTRKASPAKKAAKKVAAKKAAKAASVRAHAATKPSKSAKAGKPTTPQSQGRKAAVITLISRSGGATISKLVEATGWKANSIFGLMSTLGKSIKIESSKNDGGERVYQHHA